MQVRQYYDSFKNACKITNLPWLTMFTMPTKASQERSNASGLATEFCSWIFIWLNSVGQRWLRFAEACPDVASNVCESIPLQTLVVCWDSLKTNLAVLKGLRNAGYLAHKHQQAGRKLCSPLLSVRCGLHQLALSRKHIIFQFKSHWSSIVRLAHLFETHSFRKQFQKCLLRVLSSSFVFCSVVELPRDFQQWRQARNRASGLSTDDPSYSLSRISTYSKLFSHDNGDPASKDVTHWCQGACCKGSTPEEKKRFALVQIARAYIKLFGAGFAVPLTYRWLKAHPALHFVKEGCLLHQILPRTLEQIAQANPGDDERERELKDLFADVEGDEPSGNAQEQDDKAWEALLLQVYNAGDLSPSEINQKRKQMTFQTFRQADFVDKTLLMQYLIGPLVSGMDTLLKRTGHITEIHQLPQSESERKAQLMARTVVWPLCFKQLTVSSKSITKWSVMFVCWLQKSFQFCCAICSIIQKMT